MANDKAEDLNKVAKTRHSSINEEGGLENRKKDSESFLYNIDSKYKDFEVSNRNNHKSFDFSNVAIFADETDYDNTKMDTAYLRRFHQMTLYIQAPLYHHGNRNGQTLSGDTALITANLPSSLSYDIGSVWSAPLSFGSGTTNLLMQLGGKAVGLGNSGTSRATTMLIWDGAKPLKLNLKIPVLDDSKDGSHTNLVEALEFLGSLALPDRGINTFYTPPPSPLNATIKYMTNVDETGKPTDPDEYTFHSTYGRIILQLGGILMVDHCIIEGFSVSYPNTKTMIRHDYTGENFGYTGKYYLHPMLAEVNLKISTIEAMTASDYSNMLWARSNSMGSGTLDLTGGLAGVLTGRVFKAGRDLGVGLNSKPEGAD